MSFQNPLSNAAVKLTALDTATTHFSIGLRVYTEGLSAMHGKVGAAWGWHWVAFR